MNEFVFIFFFNFKNKNLKKLFFVCFFFADFISGPFLYKFRQFSCKKNMILKFLRTFLAKLLNILLKDLSVKDGGFVKNFLFILGLRLKELVILSPKGIISYHTKIFELRCAQRNFAKQNIFNISNIWQCSKFIIEDWAKTWVNLQKFC